MTIKRLAALALVAAMTGLGLTVAQSPAQADTIIGIEYQHSGYGGSYLNVTVGSNGFTCTGTTSDVDATLSGLGNWNDQISSFRTYANCWARHWEHSNFGGATTGYQPTTSYIGDALNDRTSSIQWS